MEYLSPFLHAALEWFSYRSPRYLSPTEVDTLSEAASDITRLRHRRYREHTANKEEASRLETHHF